MHLHEKTVDLPHRLQCLDVDRQSVEQLIQQLRSQRRRQLLVLERQLRGFEQLSTVVLDEDSLVLGSTFEEVGQEVADQGFVDADERSEAVGFNLG